MPTYDYQCSECKHSLEVVHSMSAEPMRKCPKCGRLALRRQISSSTSFALKGARWAKDGYAGHDTK